MVRPDGTQAKFAEIEGYASVFGAVDQIGDVVQPGAFSVGSKNTPNLIHGRSRDVMMLYQHTAEEPIGKWTLIKEDAHGLFVRGAIMMGTRRGRDTYELVRGGALKGLSIGFKSRRVRRRQDGGRDLLAVDLWEISIVSFPMASSAQIIRVGSVGEPLPRNLLTA